MENYLAGIIELWVAIGLYDVILPFMFLFTLVFVLLQHTKVLGSYKNVDAMVAFCIGFIATASLQTVTTIHMFFSAVGFFVVAGLCVILIASMFGVTSLVAGGKKWYHRLPRYIIFLIVGGAFLYMIAVAFGFDTALSALVPRFSSAVVQMVIAGAIFVLIIWYIIGGDGGGGSEKESGRNGKHDDAGSRKDADDDDSANELLERIPIGSKSFERKFS